MMHRALVSGTVLQPGDGNLQPDEVSCCQSCLAGEGCTGEPPRWAVAPRCLRARRRRAAGAGRAAAGLAPLPADPPWWSVLCSPVRVTNNPSSFPAPSSPRGRTPLAPPPLPLTPLPPPHTLPCSLGLLPRTLGLQRRRQPRRHGAERHGGGGARRQRDAPRLGGPAPPAAAALPGLPPAVHPSLQAAAGLPPNPGQRARGAVRVRWVLRCAGTRRRCTRLAGWRWDPRAPSVAHAPRPAPPRPAHPVQAPLCPLISPSFRATACAPERRRCLGWATSAKSRCCCTAACSKGWRRCGGRAGGGGAGRGGGRGRKGANAQRRATRSTALCRDHAQARAVRPPLCVARCSRLACHAARPAARPPPPRNWRQSATPTPSAKRSSTCLAA